MDLTELPCDCPICANHTAKELQEMEKTAQIQLSQNIIYIYRLRNCERFVNPFERESLWELVEQRVRSHPKLLKALKKTRDFLPLIERLSPVDKMRGIRYFGVDSFYRPEVYQYFQKIGKFQLFSEKHGIICLPELDLPGINGISLKQWIQTLQKETGTESKQILIISNWFGIVPLELAEIYPLSQHEGSPDYLENSPESRILKATMMAFLQNNSHLLESIQILVPTQFNNEYNELQPFESEFHLINYFKEFVSEEFPNTPIQVYTNIEDLLANNSE